MAENCVENKLPCCGCGACAVICPVKAIEIKLSAEGFYQAVINKSKCINCGACVKVCPKFGTNFPRLKKFEDFPLSSAWSNDAESRVKSSSGALAHEIALFGLSHGYKIAGVIYDAKKQSAKTVVVSDKKGLEDLRGSKYLQSFTSDAFAEIAKSKDKFIVFGAPCQCASLKMLAKQKKFEDKVILVDFFCHGVPSLNLWRATLKENLAKLNMPKADKVNFRSKKYGWGEFVLSFSCGQSEEFLASSQNNFYTLFFSDLFLCEACYKCSAKKSFDVSDIRLGDFWGLEPDGSKGGVSAVVPISAAGRQIMDDLNASKAVSSLPQLHLICRREQACFKDTPLNPALRAHLFEMLAAGKGTEDVLKAYFKALPFKKYMILKIKSILPPSLKKTAKKIYRSFK